MNFDGKLLITLMRDQTPYSNLLLEGIINFSRIWSIKLKVLRHFLTAKEMMVWLDFQAIEAVTQKEKDS